MATSRVPLEHGLRDWLAYTSMQKQQSSALYRGRATSTHPRKPANMLLEHSTSYHNAHSSYPAAYLQAISRGAQPPSGRAAAAALPQQLLSANSTEKSVVFMNGRPRAGKAGTAPGVLSCVGRRLLRRYSGYAASTHGLRPTHRTHINPLGSRSCHPLSSHRNVRTFGGKLRKHCVSWSK
jgi:hypothetical protein